MISLIAGLGLGLGFIAFVFFFFWWARIESKKMRKGTKREQEKYKLLENQ